MFRNHVARGVLSRPLYSSSATATAPTALRCRYPRAAQVRRLSTTIQLQAAVKRTRKTVKLSDLPQGKIPAKPLPVEEQNGPPYPTVVLQARQNMDKFDKCVLLTRVGSFYELYFEHAEEYAPLLDLKLTSKKTSAANVPMYVKAGFPCTNLNRYLKTLVGDLNRHVAVAEEFPNDASHQIKSGGLMHDRRVARVFTPGTFIEEEFMDPYVNNYIMAIHIPQGADAEDTQSTAASTLNHPPDAASTDAAPIGLAWLDLSTGQFFTQTTTLSGLPSILSRIAPRELVLDQTLELQKDHHIFSLLTDDRHLVTFSPHGSLASLDDWEPFLESDISKASREGFTEDEIAAGGLVLNYVRNTLQGQSMRLQAPLRYNNMQIMTIDKNSLRALEIKQTIRDGFLSGSLLHAIRRTVTKGGARLLNEWLGSPSTSLEVIEARQDLVARFIGAKDLRDSLVGLLRRSHDCHRLSQRFALGQGSPDDLLGLASSIRAAAEITTLLEQASRENHTPSAPDCLSKLASRIDLEEPLKLAQRIEESIDEDGIVQQQEAAVSEEAKIANLAHDVVTSEGTPEDAAALLKGKKKKKAPTIREMYGEDMGPWIVKPAASKELQKLHDELASLMSDKANLEEALRERLRASTLTLKWATGVGHIAHIKGKDAKNLAEIKTVSSSRSTRSFQVPEWTTLGERIDQAKARIRREEQRVFQTLKEHVAKNLIKLRRIAAMLDEIDVATSFAELAVDQKLVRPKLNESRTHVIKGGRHPTVEGGLRARGRDFVCNDCDVGPPPNGLIWLITGPNMAGKSTFLRQNALITIMAQIGCYVPAEYAELGIVDAIFSRVGSADSLYHDQSTFMVEMLETAQILRQATPRSFVIMDEVGRGTTPEAGTAISFACLHHLVTVNQCRTLFATHFHDVADMAAAEGFCEPKTGFVQTYCTDVKENEDGSFVYIYKLQPGVNRQSHALKVARLAGLPQHAIDVARKVLEAQDAKDSEAGDGILHDAA
ncbi:DNA mismatch repair protein [Trichoderma longibrachiatum]|uniref:DNA mismatch repair protein n=1 Tax=Trichoderma longibrachiatum ATCC 18648 TaxID=983965 RepID=A0A2T4CIZ0_TRILO|nr:DNA mismatch repair protein [Trichoderma longibrachiatum ATCC 18648]